MFYYLIIALQGFCVYHCYVNRNSYYWIFAILFLPVVGSLLYLFMNVVQKSTLEKAQKELVKTLNPTKEILDLEKKVKFADTFQNKVALADAYLNNQMFAKAIETYESSRTDMFKDDYYVLSKLQEASFFNNDIDGSLAYAALIKDKSEFLKSTANFIYAKALEASGDLVKAEEEFYKFDAPYNYYQERVALADFLIRNHKHDKAKIVLNDFLEEAENLSKTSKRDNKQAITKARELFKSLSNVSS